MRPTSMFNGISFIASTLVNHYRDSGGPVHVSPSSESCEKLSMFPVHDGQETGALANLLERSQNILHTKMCYLLHFNRDTVDSHA